MQANKHFTTLEPCKVISCKDIVCPELATCFTKGSIYNKGSMNITCKPGYELATNVVTTNLKCNWKGMWTPSAESGLPAANCLFFFFLGGF